MSFAYLGRGKPVDSVTRVTSFLINQINQQITTIMELYYLLLSSVFFALVSAIAGLKRKIGLEAAMLSGFFLNFIGLIITLKSPRKFSRYQPISSSKAEKLLMYKQLFDAKLIDGNEFEHRKAQILNG